MSGKTTCNRILLLWVVVCWLSFFADSSSAQLLEFVDDFRKPRKAQRNPWEERIETERHDFTQSAITVGKGVRQFELGYSIFAKDTLEESETVHTTPEMLFRYGLSEDIEFRVRWNHAWKYIEEEEDLIGSEDLRLSLKLQITRSNADTEEEEVEEEPTNVGELYGESSTGCQACKPCWLPTSALEIRFTAPTAGEPFSSDRVDYGLDYIYQWQIRERVTFAGSSGFGSNSLGDVGYIPDEPEEEFFIAYSQSFVLGMEVTQKNTFYAEWFGVVSDGLPDEFVTSTFNIGFDHYFSDNFVFDLRTGWGLTEDSDDFFAGVGGGVRF